MKILLISLFIISAAQALSDETSWNNYKETFSKSYKNIVEEKQRYNIFLSNLEKIKKHNEKYENGESSFKMGVNKFADLTSEEFLERMKYGKNSKPTILDKQEAKFDFDVDLPAEVDWTRKGAVTRVKDQGDCGSCWSFSTTGTVESQNYIKTGKLLSLSEQQLVDCALNCSGCMGCYMDKALDYIIANGIMPEGDYPYEAIDDKCRFNKSDIAVRVKAYKYIKAGDENDLKRAVATIGPVSVAISASDAFQLYHSGVLDDKECGNTFYDLNHGVLATGYGSKDGKDYWIVKNSWGTDWGMNGYIWMSRNKKNQCGITTDAVFPQI